MSRRRKRGSGEGSIYKRKDGRWVAGLTIGSDANGRQRRRHFYGRNRREVEEKLARARADQLDGLLLESQRIKLGDFLERWLQDDVSISVRPTTLASYRSTLKNHVIPHLGGVKISKLTPAHIQALYGLLQKQGRSPRLRQYVHAVLHRALLRAVRWQLIVRNPCDAVARPRVPRKEIHPLSTDEVRTFLNAARDDHLEALYVLAVTTGLRQGELLGLRWSDVDLKKGTLQVRRSVTEVNGKLDFSEPKTAKGRRQITLPQIAVDSLRLQRKSGKATPHPSTLIFPDAKGGPIRKQNLVRRSFRPLLERAGIRRIRFHDLRHTAATLLLAEGVHPKVVQERLGHATISLTLDVYSHVVEGMQKEAASKLDALLG